MARTSIKKTKDTSNGCALFEVTAESKGKVVGPTEVELPTRRASFSTFVEKMGGEEQVRKLAMDQKIIRIQATLRANSTGASGEESDLD